MRDGVSSRAGGGVMRAACIGACPYVHDIGTRWRCSVVVRGGEGNP